jgi:hypothetical protein
MNFLNTTELRDEPLALEFQRQLRLAQLDPKTGSIAACQNEQNEVNEYIRYMEARVALEEKAKLPQVPLTKPVIFRGGSKRNACFNH